MGDRISGMRLRPTPDILTASAEILAQTPRDVVTASAQALYGSAREQYAVQYKTWQQELWTYTKSVGEYGGVMDWFAAGISRMHLTAAVIYPGQREPELLDDPNDPAVQLVHRLVANARHGETQYLYKWGRQLGTPGVGYFLGWTNAEDGLEYFDVKSAQQIRRSTVPFRDERGKVLKDRFGQVLTGYDVRTGPDQWEKLPYSQLVGRIYRPDDELDYEPTSWSRAALTTLREIDLYNRHIVATLLSRLVFNGFLLIPEELVFPVNEQFKDAPDPFIAELLAVASRGIRDPGSPASAIPFPIRIPAAYVDKFIHVAIANAIDPKTIEGRQAAVQRLAEQLPAPPEAMEGKGDTNHWNAWKDSEDNVKMYFGPTMEILVGGHTDIYLHPMLRAANEPIRRDGDGRVVVWYDASDLIVSPDNSENAQSARENVAINEPAYRRLLGLDEDDAPTKKQRRELILTDLARQGLPTPDSFYLLYPEDKPAAAIDPATGQPIDPATGLVAPPGPGVPKPVAAPPAVLAERETAVKEKPPETKPTRATDAKRR